MYGYAAKKAKRTENVNAGYRLKSSTIGSVNNMCNGRSKVTVRSIFMRARPFTAVCGGGGMFKRFARRVRMIFLYVSDMHRTGTVTANAMKMVHH